MRYPALALLVLASCVTNDPAETAAPALATVDVARLLPGHVRDRAGWSEDIVAAIRAADREPTVENVCAVVAIVGQESNFDPNPAVTDLPQLVHEGLLKKLSRLGPLAEPALAALLSGKAPGTEETFAKRVETLRTERDLDRLFRDIANTYGDKFPGTFAIASALTHIFGKGGLENLNPVTTAGSMQVKVAYARTLDDFGDLSDAQARERLYTRPGGLRAGVARLLAYPAAYTDIKFRFADYNAGVYASRNAAFQSMLADLTGQKLALDGDVLIYAEDGDAKTTPSKTFTALRAFGEAHDIWAWTLSRDAHKEKTAAFEETTSWAEVRAAWEAKTGRKAAYAVMPNVALDSPKIQRKRSTAWFAGRVLQRYQSCRARR